MKNADPAPKTPRTPKSPVRKLEEQKQSERQNGGRDVVGGSDPAETDPERGERTP